MASLRLPVGVTAVEGSVWGGWLGDSPDSEVAMVVEWGTAMLSAVILGVSALCQE